MRPVHLRTKAATVLITALLVMNGATAQEVGETTGALPKETSNPPMEKNRVDHTEPTGPADSGMILVSKRPIEVLARPSSSSVVMYGFPAGRRFRLIGREAGFAQIQDLKSGATGWIDESGLEQSPRVPAASEPKPAPRTHKAKTVSAEPKPKTHTPAASGPRTHKASMASAERKPKTSKKGADTPTSQTPKRRGIFGLRHNNAQGVLY
jgi:hypothetical protein